MFLCLASNSQDKPKTDTIEVVLLVTDEKLGNSVFAAKAYSVRKWDSRIVSWFVPYDSDGTIGHDELRERGWVHDHYLDKNKKPLPKNIIVWMQKP